MPAVVKQGNKSGRPDGGVDLADPPRTAECVGDDHADLDTEPVGQRRAQRARGSVRVGWQQHDSSRLAVGVVHAGRGEYKPVPCLHDARRAMASDHAYGFRLDRGLTQPGGIGARISPPDSALGLADHL